MHLAKISLLINLYYSPVAKDRLEMFLPLGSTFVKELEKDGYITYQGTHFRGSPLMVLTAKGEKFIKQLQQIE